MNFAIILVRILVIVAILVGIGVGCYFLFFKGIDDVNAIKKYQEICVSSEYETFNSSVSNSSSNALMQYGTTIASDYEEGVALYTAEWQVATVLMPEIYYGKKNADLEKLDELWVDYSASLKETNSAISTFKTDKANFGGSPSVSEQSILTNEFKYIATKLKTQSEILAQINDLLYSYTREYVYGGDSVASTNVKFMVTESLYKQASTLLTVLNNTEATVENTLLNNTNQILEKYKKYKDENFVRSTNPSGYDSFIKNYSKINKEQFFNATDKMKYYNDLPTSNEDEVGVKLSVSTIMNYLGYKS